MAGETRKKIRTRRVVVLSLAGALALGLAGAAIAFVIATSAPAEQPAAQSAATPEPSPTVVDPSFTIAAMGDMLPHDAVNKNALQPDGTYSYAPFFTGIQPLYADAELVFCNQEVPSAGVELGVSGYPVFNAPQEFAVDLKEKVGCNLINLATNHAADLGPAGITRTLEVWDTLQPASISGINRSVEEQNTIHYTEVRGTTVALVSFAEYSNLAIDDVSLNRFGNTELFDRLLTEAVANADVVLLSMHWGTEDSHAVNATQQSYAQRAADLGVDVILGTGPHVLQPVTWLNRADGGRTLVWYSLGNMLSTQLKLNQRIGVVATFGVRVTDDQVTIEQPVAHLTYMHYDWTAEQEAAGDLLSRTNLSLNPLAASAGLLAQTRFAGVSVESITAEMAGILGPDVTVVAD